MLSAIRRKSAAFIRLTGAFRGYFRAPGSVIGPHAEADLARRRLSFVYELHRLALMLRHHKEGDRVALHLSVFDLQRLVDQAADGSGQLVAFGFEIKSEFAVALLHRPFPLAIDIGRAEPRSKQNHREK